MGRELEAAMEFLRRVEELRGDRALVLEAEVAALLGERERAMRLLEESETSNLFYLRHSGALRSLRDYPPFQELLRPEG